MAGGAGGEVEYGFLGVVDGLQDFFQSREYIAVMLRRFAPDTERPTPSQLREWHVGRLFDGDGMPINIESGLIIQQFIDNPKATISAIIISKRTQLNPYLVRSYCRQMCVLDVLTESPPMSACFALSQDAHANESLIQKIRNSCNRFGFDAHD